MRSCAFLKFPRNHTLRQQKKERNIPSFETVRLSNLKVSHSQSNMDIFILAIGKFVYGFRTGLLDAAITDESKRFYEAIKVVLSNSVTLSRSKWIKYLNRKVYNELKYGMKNWYNNGVQQTKRVMDLVQNAEKMGKDLDESIGILFYLILGYMFSL